MGKKTDKKLIIDSTGEESFILKSDLRGDVTFDSADHWVEERTRELIEARPDWTADTPHVQQCRAKWRDFYSKFQPGDRIAVFCTSDESWLSLAGRAGYLLLRNNRIIAHEISKMN